MWHEARHCGNQPTFRPGPTWFPKPRHSVSTSPKCSKALLKTLCAKPGRSNGLKRIAKRLRITTNLSKRMAFSATANGCSDVRFLDVCRNPAAHERDAHPTPFLLIVQSDL